ncbi:hypothetical protein [Micromonospora sp. IBSANI012]
MRRTSRIVVALLVSGPLGACGSGVPPESGGPTSGPEPDWFEEVGS